MISKEIGVCPNTGYFCTGTLLNDMEMELLEEACLVIPNSAHEGIYGDPCFRTLVTPPYAQKAMGRFFQAILPQLTDFLRENPLLPTEEMFCA